MNEDLFKERAKEMKIHSLIIIIVNSATFFIGYIILKKEITYKLEPKAFYILMKFIFILLLFLYYFITKKSKFKSDHIIGIILSSIFSLSLAMLIFTKTIFYQFYLYLLTEIIYHYSEYISVIIYHFYNLDYKSFLLDHSNEWIFALIFSYLESIIGTIYFREIKQNIYTFYLGIIITIIGQMTTGFYGIARHPSYFGFLVWTIGTQLMLLNIICLIGFPFGLYMFFSDRIIEEEGLLIEFFGNDYIEYKKKVGILMPFINMDEKEVQEHLEKFYEDNPDAKTKTDTLSDKNKDKKE